MKILVLGKTIETTEISDIYEVERDKKMFMNRDAGFIIERIDKKPLVFKESIPYESYPREIYATKNKWKALMNKVIDQWQKDKHDIKEFKL